MAAAVNHATLHTGYTGHADEKCIGCGAYHIAVAIALALSGGLYGYHPSAKTAFSALR